MARQITPGTGLQNHSDGFVNAFGLTIPSVWQDGYVNSFGVAFRAFGARWGCAWSGSTHPARKHLVWLHAPARCVSSCAASVNGSSADGSGPARPCAAWQAARGRGDGVRDAAVDVIYQLTSGERREPCQQLDEEDAESNSESNSARVNATREAAARGNGPRGRRARRAIASQGDRLQFYSPRSRRGSGRPRMRTGVRDT